MSEMGYKAHQGLQSKEFREKISAERIERFRKAIGAKERGAAPPTFMTVLRSSEFALLDQVGIPLKRVLHAEQGYTYDNPIQAGDEILSKTTVTQVLEKKGSTGGMAFFVLETEYSALRSGARVSIGKSRTNFVVRHSTEGAS